MYIRNAEGYIKITMKKRKKRLVIAFTGHRPDARCMGGYNWNTSLNKAIMNQLRMAILQLMVDSGCTEFLFICGGALGIDQMACEILLEFKERLAPKYDIKIRMAVPFEDQPIKWVDKVDLARYARHLRLVDEIVYVDAIDAYNVVPHVGIGRYHKDKLLTRNIYMLDECDHLIAVFDGVSKGGTSHCVNAAIKKKKPITYVRPISKESLFKTS